MDNQPPVEPEEIEVGAADNDLRLWRAKEAVRQGEGRLNAQAQARVALEGRGTATTGWASASLLALVAAGFASPAALPRIAIAATGLLFLTAAGLCIAAIRPRDWAMVGYDPTVILDDDNKSELEALESVALGLSDGIQGNNRRLKRTGQLLRYAGWTMIAAPIIGGLIYGLGLLIS